MEAMLNQQAARQVYTLCYRITACPQAARVATQEALTDPRPLPKAVALCVERAPGLEHGAVASAGCTPLERALLCRGGSGWPLCCWISWAWRRMKPPGGHSYLSGS